MRAETSTGEKKGCRSRFLAKLICESLWVVAQACVIASFVWLSCRLFGYNFYIGASIRKILANHAVFAVSPDVHLFSQYREYGISHSKGWLDDKQTLEIKGGQALLRLGVWNSGPVTLRGVRLFLQPPKGVAPVLDSNFGQWIEAQFLNAGSPQYEYRASDGIYSDTGWVIPAPLTFDFPKADEYVFRYGVLAEDWAPLKGRMFVVKRLE